MVDTENKLALCMLCCLVALQEEVPSTSEDLCCESSRAG